MTISKEERAELRELTKAADGEWMVLSPGELVFANDATNWAGSTEREEYTVLAIAAVNAMPVFLAALDAADERIAELEALWRLREKEHALAARMVARKAGQLKEANARIAELEAAAQSAIFALQPTWAQDPASSPATLGRAIAAHQESLQALAKGCDYVASQTDGYDRLVADPMVALGLLAVVETDEDGDTTYKRVRPAPIPALPEGGA